jgi:hypothetical protein
VFLQLPKSDALKEVRAIQEQLKDIKKDIIGAGAGGGGAGGEPRPGEGGRSMVGGCTSRIQLDPIA